MEQQRYWRLVWISITQMIGVNLLLPFLAPYFASLGYSEAWISTVFAILPAMMVVSSIIFGELSDYVGRSWMIRLGFMGHILAFLLYFSGQAWAIILGRVIDGVAWSATSVLLFVKIQDQLDNTSRGRYTGALLSLQTGVRMLAPLVGGFLADVYIGVPFFTSIGVYVALFFALRGARFHQKRHVAIHPWRSVRWFFRNWALQPMLVLGPFMSALIPAIMVFLPLYVSQELALPYRFIGIAVMVYWSGNLLQFFFGHLSDLLGRRKLIILGVSIKCAALIAIAAWADSYITLLLILFVFGVGSGLWNVNAWSYMSDIAERDHKEGIMVGTYQSLSKVGEVASYLFLGGVVTFFGLRDVFFILGAVGSIGALWAGALFLRDYLVRG